MLIDKRSESFGVKLTSGDTEPSGQLLCGLKNGIRNGYGGFHERSITLVIPPPPVRD
jgi:hypothetical protein